MMMMAKLNMWSHWGYAVLRRNWTKTRVICLSIPFCRRGATSSRGVPEFIDIDPACKKMMVGFRCTAFAENVTEKSDSGNE